MSSIQVWKEGETGEPNFPQTFDVVKKASLQVTDIVTNRNKYYAIELHSAGKKFRIYTHYGRTDAGWLGNGIYFGDATDISLNYAASGRNDTSLIAVANVALGKMKNFNKITYGLKEPPNGYDSCHGVRGTEFSDDEYVIYNQNQQKLEYLVECEE